MDCDQSLHQMVGDVKSNCNSPDDHVDRKWEYGFWSSLGVVKRQHWGIGSCVAVNKVKIYHLYCHCYFDEVVMGT